MYDTFINLDFKTSMASTTILQINSLKASRLQCHSRVRRERSTYAWRVLLESRFSFLNIWYTLSRRLDCVANELLRKKENYINSYALNKYLMSVYYTISKVIANDYKVGKYFKIICIFLSNKRAFVHKSYYFTHTWKSSWQI